MTKQPGSVVSSLIPHHHHATISSPLRMARYISHNSDWAAMATVSAREPTVGYPFANIFSVSDGPVGKMNQTV